MKYNMNEIVGQSDILFITLDTLRHDVAQQLFEAGELPNFADWLPETGWEARHTPGSFTYAAHQAFFAGFLPTPAAPGQHPRYFAAKFAGSETTTPNTFVFNENNIVTGLEHLGYRTICIGGVGFFNKRTALSNVFPSLFKESYWVPKFGVTEPKSTQYQFEKAAQLLRQSPQKTFLFINVSALHQPNYFYGDTKGKEDTLETHAAALRYVDSQLPILQDVMRYRPSTFVICCADHGTTYGEEGYTGHRLGHPAVWTVPYLETLISK